MRLISLIVVLALPACALLPAANPALTPRHASGQVGLLVMAHGGSAEWNRSVSEVVEPLRQEMPTVIAFGMADPTSLAEGLDSLEVHGVERVVVVRLFVSGESFLAQTEYLLGLSPDRPDDWVLMGHDPATVRPIERDLEVATHRDGLMESPQARRILVDRTVEVSSRPGGESVLVLAHGMGDESANERVLQALDPVVTDLESLGFAAVAAATLREDWADERERAEVAIRRFVADETAAGRRAIVVPVRLSGFGPYADVLDGLQYAAGGGLVPHFEVTEWIRDRASSVICSRGWKTDAVRCSTEVTDSVHENR